MFIAVKQFYVNVKKPLNFSNLSDILKLTSPVGHMLPVILLYFIPSIIEINETAGTIIQKLSIICLVILGLFFLNALLNLINVLYKKTSEATSRPIKGFLQLFQI